MFSVPPEKLDALEAMISYIKVARGNGKAISQRYRKNYFYVSGLGTNHTLDNVWFAFKFEPKNSLVSMVEPGQ